MPNPYWETLEEVDPPAFRSDYQRTVVFGDIHGDLEVMLRSMEDKRILRYHGDHDAVRALVAEAVRKPFSTKLEKMVVKQRKPLQMVFIGDLVDRYHQGYQVIQFLQKIRWEQFRIHAVFIMGNHDLMNLEFFVNPFPIHRIHEQAEVANGRQAEFISRMGLGESVRSFMSLHESELREVQTQFYRKGRLSWDLGHGRLTLRYPKDLSVLTTYRGETEADWQRWLHQAGEALGMAPVEDQDQYWASFRNRLMDHLDPSARHNWWDIQPPGHGNFYNRFDPLIERGGLPHDDELPEGERRYDYNRGERPFRDALPLDWRVVSLVWRKHYGNFFKRMKVVHLDGNTLFAHGGLSVQSMIDTHGFGVLYHYETNCFHGIENGSGGPCPLSQAVDRINRLARQAVTNALNDYSFEDLPGLELWDDLGAMRGAQPGFTQFGSFLWTDFNHVYNMWEPERVGALFQAFLEATRIRRVICGHTRFQRRDDNLRYLINEKLLKLGLESICVDNSASRGYRGENPVLTGIEINAKGKILDPGGTLGDSAW